MTRGRAVAASRIAGGVIRSKRMTLGRPSGDGWSRRALLASCSLLRLPAASPRGAVFPSEISRYRDPSTDFEVARLTDPAHSSYLPDYYCTFISRKRDLLIYASDRAGSLQAFRMDVGSGQNRQLTEAVDLDAATLRLLPDGKHFAYFDGRSLRRASLRDFRSRLLYEIPEGYHRGEGFSISANGKHATLVETAGERSRIRLLDLRRRKAFTVIETEGFLRHPAPRPKRTGILYRGPEGALWTVSYDGDKKLRLRTAPGRIGQAIWSRSGDSVLYLSYPAGRAKPNELRELSADTSQDRLIAKTSRFVHFGSNRNASVFVGASGGGATPHILLLVRAGGRELTLCEHRASDAARVRPMFSPDSRRIYFQSDRDGKSSIYTMIVEAFVEATGQ